MIFRFITIIFVFTIFSANAQENSIWSFEAHAGAPVNIPLPLTIKQSGFPDIKLNAHYYSKPFILPPFWVCRLSKWKNNKAWELEMMHQKLYLKNLPPEIQYFKITHGFNQIFLSRAYKFKLIKEQEFIFKGGAGFVLAHAENKIRNKELNQELSFFNLGYYVGGPTIDFALAKQIELSKHFYINLESKFNVSYAKIPIVDGHASVWHSAFEFIFGLGYNFVVIDRK